MGKGGRNRAKQGAAAEASSNSKFDLYSCALWIALTCLLSVVSMTPMWRMFSLVLMTASLLFPAWHYDGTWLTVGRRIAVSVVGIVGVSLFGWWTWPLSIQIFPSAFALGADESINRTNVVVVNNLDEPVYGVYVEVGTDTTDIASENICAFPVPTDKSLVVPLGSAVQFDADVVMLDTIDDRRRQAIVLVFHELGPREQRRVLVFANKYKRASGFSRVVRFSKEPPLLHQNANEVDIDLQHPPAFTVKGFRLKAARIQEQSNASPAGGSRDNPCLKAISGRS